MMICFLLFSLINPLLAENETAVFTTTEGETSDTCPNVTVLESVTEGWYDACVGLKKQVDKGTAELCKATCTDDMHCSVWQLVNNSGTPNCYSGSTFHGCLARGGGDADSKAVQKFEGDLIAGESLQHGFIKVVSTNSAETMGLHHFVEKTGEDAEKMERCKKICYTDTTCTVWQYGGDGCWVEHKPGNAAGEVKADSTWTKGMLGGETIEHTCPPYEEEEGLPWPWIIAGIVLGLLLLGLLAYFLKKKPKVKKTRSIKVTPKPAVPTETVYLIPAPQPTMLIPQTSIVQVPQYQPVTTMAPTTTYTTTAPTTTYAAPMAASTPLISGGGYVVQ